jgi:hypothetical protein
MFRILTFRDQSRVKGTHDRLTLGRSFTRTVTSTFTSTGNLELPEVAFQLSHEFIGYDTYTEFTELSVEDT